MMISTERELLALLISIRYWELEGSATTQSKDYFNQLLDDLKPNEKAIDDGVTKSNIRDLTGMLRAMLSSESVIEKNLFQQNITHAIKGDPELRDSILSATVKADDNINVDLYVRSGLQMISEYLRRREFFEMVKEKTKNLYFNKDNVDVVETSRELINALSSYSSKSIGSENESGIKNPLVVSAFSTTDTSTIESIWNQSLESTSSDHVLKTGYQGLNRALGPQGGLFRGDTVVIGALQHKYKSGTMTDLMVDIPYYNTANNFDPNPNTKAAIINISLENHSGDDLQRMYKRIYVKENGTLPTLEDITNTSPEQVAEMMDKAFQKGGYQFFYMKFNPSSVGYQDIQRVVLEIEAQGYEIHVLGIDYLSMLNLKGIPRMGDGTEYQELFRLMRNFCSERNITLITPHQLSTEATAISRDQDASKVDFVKQVAGNSYWARCKQIDREVDVELVQQLVEVTKAGRKVTYLTMGVGKNRRVHDVPSDHKFFGMPFTEHGLIADYGREASYVGLSDLKRIASGLGELGSVDYSADLGI